MPVNGIFGLSGAQEGLEDVKIGRNNGDGTFGTNVDVPSVQLMNTRVTMRASRLEGDNRVTARRSRAIGAQITLRFGSLPFEAMDVLIDAGLESSGASPDVYQFFMIGNQKMPVFGICGRSDGDVGEGSLQMFVPNCTIVEDFEIRMELNAFIIPELTVEAVADDNFTDANGVSTILIPIEYETAQAVELPPINF